MAGFPDNDLARDLLRSYPPNIKAGDLGFRLRDWLGLRGSPAGRLLARLLADFDGVDGDAERGLQRVPLVAHLPPDGARLVVTGLEAAWRPPSGTQALALRSARAHLELSVLAAEGPAPGVLGVLSFSAAPFHPSPGHPEFRSQAEAFLRTGGSGTGAALEAAAGALSRCPALAEEAGDTLAALRTLHQGAAP